MVKCPKCKKGDLKAAEGWASCTNPECKVKFMVVTDAPPPGSTEDRILKLENRFEWARTQLTAYGQHRRDSNHTFMVHMMKWAIENGVDWQSVITDAREILD